MRPSFLSLVAPALVLAGCGDVAVPMEWVEIQMSEVAPRDGGLDSVSVGVDAATRGGDDAQGSADAAAEAGSEDDSTSGHGGEDGFVAGGSGGASSAPGPGGAGARGATSGTGGVSSGMGGASSGTGGAPSGTGGVAGDGSASAAGAAGATGEVEEGVGGSISSGAAGGLGGGGGTPGDSGGGSTSVGEPAQGGSGAGSDGAGAGGSAGGSVSGDDSSFTLAVIGSSTAAGDGASAFDFAWVGLLDDSLRAAVTTPFVLDNFARGGYTSTQLLPGSGLDGNLDDALEARPDLILVALAGSNDLSSGTTTAQFMARLTEIRDVAFAAGIPVFFVSTAPKDLDRDQREALELWARTMGESFGACPIPGAASPYSPCFIDIFHALASPSLGLASEFNSGDGIHLNDAGHARIFEVAEPIIKPYVCSRTACR